MSSGVEQERAKVVAIDGPAGAGKSTVAAHLARTFGLLNLETGAMYRALALKVSREGLNPDDASAVTGATRGTKIVLEPTEAGNRVLLDGEDVTALLRAPEVTAMASRVSVHADVRHWMVAEQRSMALASGQGVVMEGRDIGTEVFPDAAVKIFLDASAEMRGERRYEQNPVTSLEETIREIKTRDARDRSRVESPLRPAEDAVVVDTTGMKLDEVIARVDDLVRVGFSR
jgi:CMP/dCMP kinase